MKDTGKKSNTDKKGRFYALKVQEPTVERETQTGNSLAESDWVPFFRDSQNTYVNDLALRARRSPTHGAILKSKHVFTIGGGFLFFDQDGETIENLEEGAKSWSKLVNANGESLYDVFCKVARDYIVFGNAYVEIVRVDKRINVFHKDATTVRVGKNKDKFYLSNFWRDVKNATSIRDEWNIKTVAGYDGKENNTQKRFVLHLADYEPEFSFYGLPDHHGVLKWADIEYKIPTYNLDRFANGFFPSIYMALFGEPPNGKKPNIYTSEIVDTFTGEGNNSRALVELLDDPTMKAHIHEFTTVREGEFVELQKLAVDNIVSGHRWFASLAGLKTAGTIGSNQQIQSEFEIAMNTVVIPDYQDPVLSFFDHVVKIAGFEFELGIKKSSPISFLGDLDPEKFTLVEEARQQAGLDPLEEGDERAQQFVAATKTAPKEDKKEPEKGKPEEDQNAKAVKRLGAKLSKIEKQVKTNANDIDSVERKINKV